nr:hypothetical protein [Enterobacter hormaechei]
MAGCRCEADWRLLSHHAAGYCCADGSALRSLPGGGCALPGLQIARTVGRVSAAPPGETTAQNSLSFPAFFLKTNRH